MVRSSSLRRSSANTAQQPRLQDLLAGIFFRPQQLVLFWNWKAAVLSMVLRGPIFFTATLQKGWRAALVTLLMESLFCALGVGLYNALVQILRDASPQWLTVVLLTVVFPGTLQALEYLLHGLRGTPHLHAAALTSLCVGAMATLFNWFAMRRGVMLVGRKAGGLWSDLRRMPLVLLNFVEALPRWIAQKLGRGLIPRPEAAGSVPD
jgi:hypothetical protein